MVPSNLGEEMSTEVALPPEWEDDERMNFLFSDFKENRDVSTTDWDSKMDFWTSLILKICRSRGTVCVNLQELNQVFQRKGIMPLGLATVIQCMARCGKIQRESEFAANVDCGWVSWGVGLLLVKPLKWTFSTLLGSSGVTLKELFVVIELVKEKAAELLGVYRSSPVANHSLLSFQELRTLSSHVCVDESTLCMALLQLQREKQVTVSLHGSEKIVKFSQPGQNHVSPVSDVDLGIYQLQRSERLLEERVEALGLEAEKYKEEARVLLREGKKSQALRCLRSRKRVEKKADHLYAQLENVKGILDKIANSQTDKLVIQAYQAGVSALRLSLKDVTVEGAESLVDQIQELCDTQDEVNQILAGGALNSMDADTDGLEDELRFLLENSSLDEPSTLPEVPSHPLSPVREFGSLCDDLLSALPSVPQTHFNITDDELDKERSRITLADTGLQQKYHTSPVKRAEPAQ
ncbi:charged multivesicular body protein 7 [Salmo salar]|uniref:Charged multivesicular body protein 7 n=1 Tax=Salmo salar TaxID=8030 RepID=A0A1S3NK56_SALSA|nr:charged multivesicular body protein 7 [Salmo salar]XP_045559061.1 charged multivesicular body protein 7 [Salmo salar]|eukprot:XP_014015640.1 PREDICTED: charged multivesicular body protein 7 [Salmo salar]